MGLDRLGLIVKDGILFLVFSFSLVFGVFG